MIYGNLNENLQAILGKIVQSEDLLKFLFYKESTDINKLPKLSSNEMQSLIRGKKQKIFGYKKIPQVSGDNEFECFISMECGVIGRSNRNGKGVNEHFKQVNFSLFVLVPEYLESTENGSRLLAIEKCIEDTFHGKPIESIGLCYVSGSRPIDASKGYVAREISLVFVDKNEGVWNG